MLGGLNIQTAARTTDGESFLIQQLPNAPNEQHFVVLIITSIAAALDWLELGKFLLPVTQDMRLDAAQLAYLTNGEVTLGRDRRQC